MLSIIELAYFKILIPETIQIHTQPQDTLTLSNSSLPSRHRLLETAILAAKANTKGRRS